MVRCTDTIVRIVRLPGRGQAFTVPAHRRVPRRTSRSWPVRRRRGDRVVRAPYEQETGLAPSVFWQLDVTSSARPRSLFPVRLSFPKPTVE